MGVLNFGSDRILVQQIKTRGLSVRRPRKGESNSKNKTNFGKNSIGKYELNFFTSGQLLCECIIVVNWLLQCQTHDHNALGSSHDSSPLCCVPKQDS